MQKFMTRVCCIAVFTLTINGFCAAVDHAEAKDAAFFEERVAPILCAHCASCHNEQIQASDLSFYTQKEVLDGGERGPAVVPHKPDQSILIHAINRDTRNAMGLILLEGLHAFETGQAARNRVC